MHKRYWCNLLLWLPIDTKRRLPHKYAQFVKWAVLEKINYIQKANVHYAYCKRSSTVDKEILAIYFKRPSSYPASTSALKKSINEKKTATMEITRNRTANHEQHSEQLRSPTTKIIYNLATSHCHSRIQGHPTLDSTHNRRQRYLTVAS